MNFWKIVEIKTAKKLISSHLRLSFFYFLNRGILGDITILGSEGMRRESFSFLGLISALDQAMPINVSHPL